jgi:hypothetical protein
MHMFIGPTLDQFRPLHTQIHTLTQLSNKMTDPTKTSSTPTKSNTVLQSLYILSSTYS